MILFDFYFHWTLFDRYLVSYYPFRMKGITQCTELS